MKDEALYFKRKKAVSEKLLNYGFTRQNSEYYYQTKILAEQFLMEVHIKDAAVMTKLWDIENDCEYVLHTVSGAQGEFVTSVRFAYEEVLAEICENCFVDDVFKSDSTKAVMSYIAEKYGDDLEFLWPKFPENAVYRRKDNQKWYAAILTVKREKLGLDGDGTIEIIDLRLDPTVLEQTIDRKKYFPGYHMNKKHWYTICLNGSVSDMELFERIDISYNLAKKK